MPTKDNATTTTALTLKEGRALTDLMTASATATLVDGGTNTVTLGMTRKTMLIQDVTIKKIPTAATAVSVTIAPLWQALTVSGAFANAGQSQTIALTKQADNRTWTLPSPFGEGSGVRLLPPSSQPASVSVNITIGGTTKTYTYSTSDQLEAAYKINIDGTYTEAMFRLVLTDDEIPSTVAKLKFYYLGGSSTFSPKAGYGCVQSKQTEIRPVSTDGIYEIYTLPHTEEDVLTKLIVTALDANDNIIKERVFKNVPIIRNQVTRYTGSFFGSGGGNSTNDGTFRLTADPDWDAFNGYTF